MTEPNKICSECDAHAIGGWYTTPLCQSCFAERGYFGPKKEAMQMTDITRKLELIANLRPKEMWPTELGPEFGETNNWCTALSAICAEALVEIQRLRAHERASEKWLAELMPSYFYSR